MIRITFDIFVVTQMLAIVFLWMLIKIAHR